ncbi:MAG: sulfotransferase [Pyrinomonadaceae bacterium]|nr:sulfotransferase [Phycisphaerales bacterium]
MLDTPSEHSHGTTTRDDGGGHSGRSTSAHSAQSLHASAAPASEERKRFPIAFPFIHFMAMAPLDAWARLLFAPRAWVPPRYWPRLILSLAISLLGTLLTLPERLVLAPILFVCARTSRRVVPSRGGNRGAVVVLGYFRSGTTHLHYLLTCDKRFNTPRWSEALVPQGFIFSWNFLRVFLVAFLSTRRPQDDMAFGPEWPAEDDFAMCNWATVSSLPGRVILPRMHEHYKRFHDLDSLTPREHARWRTYQWAFLWKLSIVSGGRRLLLKTPCHTARVRDLLQLFGSSKETPGRVKFIHLTRTPGPVVRSNVSMMDRMSMYHLQDTVPEAEFKRRIIEEYDATERKFLSQQSEIPPGDVATMRYEDLIADPMGELKRVYRELGLEWTAQYEVKLLEYLDSVREYRSASDKLKGKDASSKGGEAEAAPKELEWMIPAFGHDRPAIPKAPLPVVGLSSEEQSRRRRIAFWSSGVTAILAGAIWLGLAVAVNNRNDWGVWVVGIATGYAAMRTAKVGSIGLGVWASLVTLLVWLAVAFAATRLIYYRTNIGPTAWEMWDATQKEIRSGATMPWAIFGILTAYRFASRKHGGLPGR